MYCVHCGAENPNGASYCRACGQPLAISRRRRWPLPPEDMEPEEQETVRAGPGAPPVSVLERPEEPLRAVRAVQKKEHRTLSAENQPSAATPTLLMTAPEHAETEKADMPAPTDARMTAEPAESHKKPVFHVSLPHLFHRAPQPTPDNMPPQPEPEEVVEKAEKKPSALRTAFSRLRAVIKERRETGQNLRAERMAEKRAKAQATESISKKPETTVEDAAIDTTAAAVPFDTQEFTEEQLCNLLFFPSSDDDPAVWGESPENLEKQRNTDLNAKKIAQIALVIGAGVVVIILVAEFAFTT